MNVHIKAAEEEPKAEAQGAKLWACVWHNGLCSRRVKVHCLYALHGTKPHMSVWRSSLNRSELQPPLARLEPFTPLVAVRGRKPLVEIERRPIHPREPDRLEV